MGLNIFGMPGNWILAGLAALWAYMHPEGALGWYLVGGLFGMALVAEAAEFIIQSWGAKRYGATGRGNWGGIIGAIIGAIMAAPILFGLGALPGALLGAYLGCLIFEMIGNRPFFEAAQAAKGAFFGKSLGLTLKLAMGTAMLILAGQRIWPA